MTDVKRLCWCGRTLEPTSYRGDGFALVRCPACGTFKIDPPPIAGDDESGEFYTAYYGGRGPATPTKPSNVRYSRFWHVVDQIKSLGVAGRCAIDFGSGDGQLCHELREAGWSDVIGLDVSRARVERARQRYPGIRFYDRPLSETDVPEGAADLCVMDNVIEHLADPKAILQGLRPYVRPSGQIVVITPNMESGVFRFLGSRWTPELAPHAHVFLFTPSSLRQLIADAGFEIQTVGTFQLEPYPLSSLVRRIASGDIKGAMWRAHQEMGAAYSRWTGAGPMVYVVASVPAHAAVRSSAAEAGAGSAAAGVEAAV